MLVFTTQRSTEGTRLWVTGAVSDVRALTLSDESGIDNVSAKNLVRHV